MDRLSGSRWEHSEFVENKAYAFDREEILDSLSENEMEEAYATISKWEGYAATPLILMSKLSACLELNKIYYKDESERFGLQSFKALGGAYAVERIARGGSDIVISTATAGNHGRSVAWGARRLGLSCKIFVSEFVSEARCQCMADLGAEIIRVRGNYQSSLEECIKQSKDMHWQIVQDVAWEGYSVVPTHTMAGYAVMMREIAGQTNGEKITHVVLQAGVGGMAAAIIAGIARYWNHVPVILVVEPDSAACVLESVKAGQPTPVVVTTESIMGGMSCGEVSLVAWEILRHSARYCMSLPDTDIPRTMQLLGSACLSEQSIIAGENSVPGIVGLVSSCEDARVKRQLNLSQHSNVLVIGCEGATDTEFYERAMQEQRS